MFALGGSILPTKNVQIGKLPDGSSFASFETTLDYDIRPHERIEVGDGARTLWIGVVRRVKRELFSQEVDVNDLTATMLGHRINAKGEPDPSFRFGDVIRYREYTSRYMVLAGSRVMSLDLDPTVFDMDDQSDWRLAE